MLVTRRDFASFAPPITLPTYRRAELNSAMLKTHSFKGRTNQVERFAASFETQMNGEIMLSQRAFTARMLHRRPEPVSAQIACINRGWRTNVVQVLARACGRV